MTKELAIQARDALETGLDYTRNKAEHTHEYYKGYYPERHAAVDMDVTDIEAAIAALTAAIDAPEPEPVATIEISVRGSSTTIDNHFSDAVRDWPCGEYKLYTHPPAAREPLSETELRAEFAKLYPGDVGILELAEHNPAFSVEAIGARHHWRAFERGARAIESAHGIGAKQ